MMAAVTMESVFMNAVPMTIAEVLRFATTESVAAPPALRTVDRDAPALPTGDPVVDAPALLTGDRAVDAPAHRTVEVVVDRRRKRR